MQGGTVYAHLLPKFLMKYPTVAVTFVQGYLDDASALHNVLSGFLYLCYQKVKNISNHQLYQSYLSGQNIFNKWMLTVKTASLI